MRGDVERIGFDEPDVAIDSGAFVPPAFVVGGVGAEGEDIFFAVVEIVGEVVAEGGVAAGVAAEAVAVDPDDGVAEDAVEFDGDAAAEVGFGDFKCSSIPADGGFGVIGADGAEAVLAKFFVAFGVEGQFDGPVVGEIDGWPFGVIEGKAGSAAGFAGFD